MENLYYNDYVKGYIPITRENLSGLSSGLVLYEKGPLNTFRQIGTLSDMMKELISMGLDRKEERIQEIDDEVIPNPKRGYETKFCEKTWLNPQDSPSTGLCVAYDGTSLWQDAGQDSPNRYRNTFFQVSDCHSSIRLHPTDDDSYEDYIKKLSKLRTTLDHYISYLVSAYRKKD